MQMCDDRCILPSSLCVRDKDLQATVSIVELVSSATKLRLRLHKSRADGLGSRVGERQGLATNPWLPDPAGTGGHRWS